MVQKKKKRKANQLKMLFDDAFCATMKPPPLLFTFLIELVTVSLTFGHVPKISQRHLHRWGCVQPKDRDVKGVNNNLFSCDQNVASE